MDRWSSSCLEHLDGVLRKTFSSFQLALDQALVTMITLVNEDF